MPIPSLQTLRAFDAAGRNRSYSKAGEELGLTHSAISHRIRELETLLGMKLFERRGNFMVPTDDGRRLLAQVRNALGLLETIFDQSGSPALRRITISISPALSRWLVPRLADLRSRLPNIDLRLDLSPQPVALGQGIEAAVRYGLGSWPNTDSSLLATEILFPVCSPEYLERHPLGEPADMLACDLLRHPWHSWAAWFEAAGVSAGEPGTGPEYSDSSLLVDAALSGEGIALSRRLGVIDRLADGTLVRPFDISVSDYRAYYFVLPSGRREPVLEEIGQWLIKEFQGVGSKSTLPMPPALAPQGPES